MANNVNVKKLEADLWESADLLRAGSKLTSNQYCMPVLGLIFLRYAYSRFKLVEREILKDRPVRGGRVLPVEQSDFAEKSALFLPKEAQYNYLVNLPANIPEQGLTGIEGNPLNSLGEVVNNAMELVEQQSEQLQGVLPKDYTIFSDELLGELLRIFNNDALDDVGGDVIGRIYEYFLNKFAKNVAQDDGVFFTPKSLVKMIVNVLEPAHGVLLDPACGSGGMFVQTGDFVNHAGMIANNTMTFYGQEKVEYNAKLCLMNMAVHGLTGVIKSGDEANTFYHDAHNLNGCCDYVMANPPFNVDKVKSESAQSAGRLPFGLPGVNKAKEIGNANYLWVSYFYSYLNEHGRAGFVMASSATDSQGKDKDIREKLIQTGHVNVMMSVGNNFFYTKSLPCSLWFLDKGKPEHLLDTVLFIDARNYYTVVDRTQNEWSDWQLKNLNAIVWLYRGEEDKYKVLLAEYHAELADDRPFAEIQAAMEQNVQAKREEAKAAVEAAPRKERKATQEKFDKELEALNEKLTVAKEAVWLIEKFGEGVYQDIPGLCKVASRDTILNEKGASLTPGAYVGVAPVEDDGVDFAQRMKEIHKELLELQAESNRLMETISKNLEEMGGMKWEYKTLDQLGTVSRGKSKHRPRNDPKLFGGKYPFIQTADVKNADYYITKYSDTYNESGVAQSKLWDKGTLCITIAANIADTGVLAFPACFPDSIMGFVPFEGVANTRFIKYCFDRLQRDCKQISQGTAQDNLSWEKLSTIKFCIPEYKEQCRIADILSAYDDLIENNQKQIKLLEEAAQRLYKEWFVDLRFPGHENTKIVDSVPEGWRRGLLKELISVNYGKDHKKVPDDGNIPVYGSGGLMRKCNKSLFSGEAVLIPRKGSLNNIMYVDETFWTVDTMFYATMKQPHTAVFVYFFVKAFDMYSMNIGAAVPSMTTKILDAMDVVIPDKETLEKFDKYAKVYFNKIKTLQGQNEQLKTARDLLLPKLMSGEVEV